MHSRYAAWHRCERQARISCGRPGQMRQAGRQRPRPDIQARSELKLDPVTDTAEFQVPFRGAMLYGSVNRIGPDGVAKVLALHGGGCSTRQGFQPLLDSLAKHGCACASF